MNNGIKVVLPHPVGPDITVTELALILERKFKVISDYWRKLFNLAENTGKLIVSNSVRGLGLSYLPS